MSATAPKTWLITGCSSGLGEEFIHELVRRGDKAIATCRGDVSRIANLKEAGAYTYSLDVTSSIATIKSSLATMIKDVGSIDVLVNNAGYSLIGFTEEIDLDDWQALFETNFFGAVKLTRAILPHYRVQRSGDIVFVGSIYGLNGQVGGVSYSSTKFALEALHDSLMAEVAQFGIRSFMFEPGFCRTHFVPKGELPTSQNQIEDYTPMRDFVTTLVGKIAGYEVGDPKKVVKIMVDLVKSEGVAEGREVPNRLILGSDAPEVVESKYGQMQKHWVEWDDVIRSTDCDDVATMEEPEYIKIMRSVRSQDA